MDIDKIIQERKQKEEEAKLQNEARKRAQTEEIERERIRREGNAAEVERHLLNVVAPVFSEAEQKLNAAGYTFSVSESRRSDKGFGGSRSFAMGLALEYRGEILATLKFEGDFQSVTLAPSEFVRSGRAILDAPMALTAVTTDYVEQRTQEFVRKALELSAT